MCRHSPTAECQGDAIAGQPCLVFVHKVRDPTSSFFRFRASYSTAIHYNIYTVVICPTHDIGITREGSKGQCPPYIFLSGVGAINCQAHLTGIARIFVDSHTCRKQSSTLFIHVIITIKEVLFWGL